MVSSLILNLAPQVSRFYDSKSPAQDLTRNPLNVNQLIIMINIHKLTKTTLLPSRKIGRDLEGILAYINKDIADSAVSNDHHAERQ